MDEGLNLSFIIGLLVRESYYMEKTREDERSGDREKDDYKDNSSKLPEVNNMDIT